MSKRHPWRQHNIQFLETHNHCKYLRYLFTPFVFFCRWPISWYKRTVKKLLFGSFLTVRLYQLIGQRQKRVVSKDSKDTCSGCESPANTRYRRTDGILKSHDNSRAHNTSYDCKTWLL